tara:strand:- start:112 stop:876 length:765 start_codon:yes stop_codon:yes gene_type:complete
MLLWTWLKDDLPMTKIRPSSEKANTNHHLERKRKMLTLHYLEDSRAQRILWMLEELELPYELKVYKRTKERAAPEELKKIHPLGRSPVITDGELVLAESGAIVEYIARTYADGKMIPSEPQALQQYLFWSHFSEGTLAPYLVMRYVFSIAESRVPRLLRPIMLMIPNLINKAFIAPRLTDNLVYVNEHLKEHEFFVGDSLTGADIMMIYPLETSLSRASDQYPHIKAYVKRIQALPSYQKALQAIDIPYGYLVD